MTLNETVSAFQSIATNHKQINHFFFGEEWDFASSGVVDCPAMILVLEPSTLTGAVLTYNFKLYIGDLVQKDLSNKTEVLSDTLQILLDVIYLVQAPTYDWAFDNQTLTITDFEDSFDCELYGHWTNLKIRVANPFDRCAVPTS